MAPSDHTLLITGATGYVAGHIIHQALAKGYNVRACIRSESSRTKILSTFPDHSTQLTFATVKNITNPDFFRDAFADHSITGVIHTASPVHLSPKDNKRDMLDPAINGSTSIIEASKMYGPSVHRVVHISSMAAMLDISKGLRPGYTYSEEDWNPMTYEEAAVADPLSVYCASKSLGEKHVWKIMESNDAKPAFSLVSINPSVIYGPQIYPVAGLTNLNRSAGRVWALVDAPMIPAPDYGGAVDVRNVAEAVLTAFETPSAAGHRYLLAKHFDWQSAADAARKALKEPHRSRIPTGRPGSMDHGAWRSVIYGVDGSKAERELGLKYLSLEETIGEAVMQLLDVEMKTTEKQAS